MSPLLSILIPTVKEREHEFDSLWWDLVLQIQDYRDLVELGYLCDNKEMTIGEKRNKLYDMATGLYSIQIDDDDQMAPGWVAKVIKAMKTKPDCITYQEKCIIDGKYFSSNHSLRYGDWWEKVDGFDYVRTPFMKDVIKTEICKSVLVPHTRFGEDHAWSRLLKPHLSSEVHIDEEIYHYIHNSTPHLERYGIKE